MHDVFGLRCRVVTDEVSGTPLVLPIGRHNNLPTTSRERSCHAAHRHRTHTHRLARRAAPTTLRRLRIRSEPRALVHGRTTCSPTTPHCSEPGTPGSSPTAPPPLQQPRTLPDGSAAASPERSGTRSPPSTPASSSTTPSAGTNTPMAGSTASASDDPASSSQPTTPGATSPASPSSAPTRSATSRRAARRGSAPVIEACHDLGRTGRTGLWNEVADGSGSASPITPTSPPAPTSSKPSFALSARLASRGGPPRRCASSTPPAARCTSARRAAVASPTPAPTTPTTPTTPTPPTTTTTTTRRRRRDTTTSIRLPGTLPERPGEPHYCTTCKFRDPSDSEQRQLFWIERRTAS